MLPFTLPLPKFLEMDSHPLAFALAQLIFTLPVLICGSRFYIVGFKTLLKGHPNMDSLVAIGTGSAFFYSLYMTVKIPSDHMAAVSYTHLDVYKRQPLRRAFWPASPPAPLSGLRCICQSFRKMRERRSL